jgi:hypothetical protein
MIRKLANDVEIELLAYSQGQTLKYKLSRGNRRAQESAILYFEV